MPKQLYNEGRVRGLSGYEIYVKQYLAENPNGDPPATERQWLASTLGFGSSLLLCFPIVSQADDAHKVIEVPLPAGSKLTATGTIFANYFHGSGETVANNAAYFATRVEDYGELISNTSSRNPADDSSTTAKTQSGVPVKTGTYGATDDWSADEIKNLKNFMRILDGVVIQPGKWKATGISSGKPYDDLLIAPSQRPVLRFHVRGPIDRRFWILLTGFSHRTVVMGESGVDGSTTGTAKADGDFLGPAQYPWASKIFFMMPNAHMLYYNLDKYVRSVGPVVINYSKYPAAYNNNLPTNVTTVKSQGIVSVDDTSVIDFRHSNPGELYTTQYTDAAVPVTVSDYISYGDGVSVITTIRRGKNYVAPPAMYGTYVNSTDNKLYPLDVVSPRTIKMFMEGEKSLGLAFENEVPYNYAIFKRSDGTLGALDENGEIGFPITVEEIDQNAPYYYAAGPKKFNESLKSQTDAKFKAVNIILKNKKYKTFYLDTGNSDGGGSSGYSALGGSDTIHTRNLTFSHILAAIQKDCAIDVVGDSLKELRTQLESKISTGKQYAIIVNNNGKIELKEVESTQFPNFFMKSFTLTPTPNTQRFYTTSYLDVFGYTPTYRTSPVVNFGTISLVAETSNATTLDGSGANWLQSFRISGTVDGKKQVEVYNELETDLAGSGDAIKITCAGSMPSYRGNGGSMDGAPKSYAVSSVTGQNKYGYATWGTRFLALSNTFTAYMHKFSGDDFVKMIVFAHNQGGTDFISSQSLLCTLARYNDSSGILYDRSSTTWTYQGQWGAQQGGWDGPNL